MDVVERKLSVCIGRECSRCPIGQKVVPEDCEYALKHVLNTDTPKVIHSARQSGKTTRVIQEAADAAAAGYPVTVVAMNMVEAKRIQRMMMGTGVEVISASQQQYHGPPRLLFSDEVEQDSVDRLERSSFHFVKGEMTLV